MVDPCKVCGGTDLNLVDGFYYCVECGTQDQTARETVVERVELSDGTFAISSRRKLTKKKTNIHMSGEWYKWHAYNFILSGLSDELIALGAKPSFKPIVLWVWTRYIKKYHNREEFNTNNAPNKNELINNNENEDPKNVRDSDDSHTYNIESNPDNEEHLPAILKDLKFVTAPLLFGILNIALNLDKSDITPSHLMRYLNEGRLTFKDFIKYIPSDFDVKKIPYWKIFQLSHNYLFYKKKLLLISTALYRDLKLGSPLIPDLRAMIKIFVKELCLPKEFLNLVLALLMHLPMKLTLIKRLKRVQFLDFELFAMCYILMALKMCFGLDDDYELKLSDAVDKINEEENYLKSYRIGITEPSDRIFSFCEWMTYLEYRKIILSQYYQPMATKNFFDHDNLIVTEILKDIKRDSQINKLHKEIEHDILKKISVANPYYIIPKEEFPLSTTPLTAYTQFLIQRLENPEMRFLLSEDFTKYSLKYACEDLVLKDDDGENVVRGVSNANKYINKETILGALKARHNQVCTEQVFIKDNDNKDWLKDFQVANSKSNLAKVSNDEMKEEVISDAETKENISSIDSKEISEVDLKIEHKIKCEQIEELEAEENIFNDYFQDIEYSFQRNSANESLHQREFVFEFNDAQLETVHENVQNDINSSDFLKGNFDPATFKREEVIERLILSACRKYKIPIPFKYKEQNTRKRRAEHVPRKVKDDQVKIRRVVDYSKTETVNNILTKYHSLQQENELQNTVPVSLNLEGGGAMLHNEVDLNITAENSEDQQQVLENPHEVETPSRMNNETEYVTMDDDNVNTNETDMDFREVIKEYDKDFDDCLENELINNILTKELVEFETDRAGKLKSLKDTFKTKNNILKPNFKARRKMSLEPLITNSDDLKEFIYYIRHYPGWMLAHQIHAFENELTANCSKSFLYIIQYCASIIEVPAISLYQAFQRLEIHMMKHQ